MAELPAHARKPEIHIKDPAAAISFHRLKNGLQVILAPTKNAKTIQLRLEVEVGQESESPREYGISHLLEHALFRHPDLTENMSFAQMVDQIGGQANGHTERRLTSYEAHVPAQQGLWLVKTYYKMIFSRQLRHEDIERSRNEVLLEIGDVHPLMQFIGFDPFEWLSLTYLKPTGFYESQFGVPWDRDLYTDNVERLSTHRLTLQQVQNYYDRFYYPNNMRLFISGPLEKMPYLQTVESVFGQIPARQGATLPPPAMPRHPSKRPFYSVKSTTSTATIETGIKVWDLEYRDEILLNVYSEYLAHELMKEIRNRRGLTYTVLPEVAIQNRWGYVGISMEAQKREYWNILKQVRNLIQRHATEGLTESEHAEALSLSARAFHLHDNDSETMLAFALTLDRFRRYYEHPESPYLVLRSIELEEFNRRLKKLFVPERAYAELVAPPLFFEGDLFLLGLLTIFLTYTFLKRYFLEPFSHTSLRWMRKVHYAPLKLTEAVTFFVIWLVGMHLSAVVTHLFLKWTYLSQHLWSAQYVLTIINIIVFVWVTMWILGHLPNKLLLTESHLIIKSLSFSSRRIPRQTIDTLYARRLWYALSWRHWRSWRQRPRIRFFSPVFWQKALFIKIKNGPLYVFSSKNAAAAARELNLLLINTD